MAKILCVTQEESLLGLKILGIEVLKIKDEKEIDYDKISSYQIILAEEKLYSKLKENLKDRLVFPLSGLKGKNLLLKDNLQRFSLKAVSKGLEL